MCRYGTHQDFAQAIQWLDDHSIGTDTRTYNILLARSAMVNDVKWAQDLLRRMIENHIYPNGASIRYLISMYIRKSNAAGIEEVRLLF
jgi:pentatricopeptide repeat protein